MKIKEWHIHYAVSALVTLLAMVCVTMGFMAVDNAWGYVGLTAAGAVMGWQIDGLWKAVRRFRDMTEE